jgi:hypothetical protein
VAREPPGPIFSPKSNKYSSPGLDPAGSPQDQHFDKHIEILVCGEPPGSIYVNMSINVLKILICRELWDQSLQFVDQNIENISLWAWIQGAAPRTNMFTMFIKIFKTLASEPGPSRKPSGINTLTNIFKIFICGEPAGPLFSIC